MFKTIILETSFSSLKTFEGIKFHDFALFSVKSWKLVPEKTAQTVCSWNIMITETISKLFDLKLRSPVVRLENHGFKYHQKYWNYEIVCLNTFKISEF